MATTFSRSTRSLSSDGYRRSLVGLVIAATLLVLWGTWFFGARVRVYAISSAARLEVTSAVHPIESTVGGRVISTNLDLGQPVEAGDVLVKLDAGSLQLKLGEERAREAGLRSQLDVLGQEIQVEEQVLGEEKNMTGLALAEARARESKAKASARFAQEKANRWRSLAKGGVISGVDGLEAEADSEVQAEHVRELELGRKRLKQERRTKITNQKALLGRLAREEAQIQGELTTLQATIKLLEHDIERHLIRAPVKGRLGEVAGLHIGGVLEAGERLGAVVPGGDIRAVALYPPADAAGRLRPGQLGRLRLEGFPWTQYGSLQAEVVSVASEPQGGQVRVELSLRDTGRTRIPLEHGLPGTAEVEVEQVAPATLVLRAAGRLVAPAPPPAPVRPSQGAQE